MKTNTFKYFGLALMAILMVKFYLLRSGNRQFL